MENDVVDPSLVVANDCWGEWRQLLGLLVTWSKVFSVVMVLEDSIDRHESR